MIQAKKDEAHGGVSKLAGKLSKVIVGKANILTKEGTNVCLPVPGEAGY